MRAAGHEPGEMRHVDHQIGADPIGDRAEAGEIDNARIGAAAGDDQPRPVLLGQTLDLLEIDPRILCAHAVMDRVKPLARQVRRGAVRQMPAGGERHAENRVAGFQQRQKYRLIGRRPGMRLHIREAAPEQARRPLDRQALGDIDELAAAVITPSGITFGIFVRQNRALRLEHRARDDILAGDQLDLRLLAAKLARDSGGDLRVGGGQGSCEKAGIGLNGIPDSR